MGTNDKQTWLALAMIICARLGLQALLYRAGFVSLTADDFGRAVAAGLWAQRPYFVWHGGAWLPFHMILVGSALRLVWDLLWVPRTVNILLGAISILLIYRLGKELFKDRRIGLFAALLLAFNPAHLWLSSGMLVEIPYLTLLLGCMLSFIVFLQRSRSSYLFLSAVLLGLANGFRFEGWMVSLFFSLYLAWLGIYRFIHRQTNLKGVAVLWVAAIVPMVFPVLWVAGSYQQTGDPFHFLSVIRTYKLTWNGSQRSFINYLITSWRIGWLIILLMFPALAHCVYRYGKSQALRWYLGITLIPLVMFLWLHGGQAEPPGNYIRYLTPFLCVFLPLLGALMVALLDYIHKLVWVRGSIFVLISLALLIQVFSAYKFTNDPAAQGLAVGQQLRALRSSGPGLNLVPAIIEVSYWEYLAIHVGANDLKRLMYDRELDFDRRDAPSLILETPGLVYACARQNEIEYLVVKDNQLKDLLEGTYSLKPEHQVNTYNFYRLPPGFSSSIQDRGLECTLPFGSGY